MKIKALVLIADKTPDTSGDRLDPKGLHFNREVVVTDNFNGDSESYLGWARLNRRGKKLYATMDLNMKKLKKLGKVFPAIGGFAKTRDGWIVTNFRVTTIGLCKAKNMDRRIPAVSISGKVKKKR